MKTSCLTARLALAGALSLGLGAPARADVVLDWNDELLETVRALAINPPLASRTFAMTHVAIHDAVSTLSQSFDPYHMPAGSGPGGASSAAAAAAAAHGVLGALYPARQGSYDALLASHLDAIPAGAARDLGVGWGEQVASAILALRADDGVGEAITAIYGPPLGSFWWIHTPPGFADALLPGWGRVRPWAMSHGGELRAPGPPVSPSERRYGLAYQEVKALGAAVGGSRSADQSEIAQFWDDGPGTTTPPGHWLWIARNLAQDAQLGLEENARLFALLSIAVADAAILSWDSKFHYHHWRPVTGIRRAGEDGNPATVPDDAWSSFIATPPFPAYTSGHSTFSGAASRLLALFFGSDEIAFSIGSDGTPGIQRSFESLSQAAEEAGQSRIYGGIHWQYDNRDALAAGRALAQKVWESLLTPPALLPETCQPSGAVLCLQGGRFELSVDWRIDAGGTVGTGTAVPSGLEPSGMFSFFDSGNLELLVKVLDGCGVNGHWWVFAAATTNVELVLRVRDTSHRVTRTYYNPLHAPGRVIQDIEGFPCSPSPAAG